MQQALTSHNSLESSRRSHLALSALPWYTHGMPKDIAPVPSDYPELLEQLKERIRTARIRAALNVNRELVLLYWRLGRDILERQKQAKWGDGVLAQLSADLKREFPEMKGFSLTNLKYMRHLAEAWPELENGQQPVDQIPWGHNIAIFTKLRGRAEREWYLRATIEHGWSRAVLVHQIESRLYHRRGKAQTNFERTLPAPGSDLAQQVLKDPYKLEFLGIGDEAHERELHRALLTHLREFLTELGVGFAFVGSEYHLDVDGNDFYIDLLFYHLKLRSFVVIELKTTDFKPEYAGKLNFYLSVVDDQLRHPDDNPSIGLILCKGKSRLVVEYALQDMAKPMGVSEHQLTEALPHNLKGQLPTVEELESEFSEELDAPDAGD